MPGMEALAFGAAECQQAQRAVLAQRHQRHRADARGSRGRTGNRAACRAPGRNAACRWRAALRRCACWRLRPASLRRKGSSSTLASEATGAVSSSTEWKASKSSRRLASSAASARDRGRRAQQAAREAMDALGEMIVGARHGDEFGEAAIGIGFLFAQHFHLALDQRDGGAGAHVRQAHACEQRLVTFEEIGIETEITLDAFFVRLPSGQTTCGLCAHALLNSPRILDATRERYSGRAFHPNMFAGCAPGDLEFSARQFHFDRRNRGVHVVCRPRQRRMRRCRRPVFRRRHARRRAAGCACDRRFP